MTYIARPSEVLWKFIQANGRVRSDQRRYYELGVLAMGLEIRTVLENLAGIPVVSDLARAEVESVLLTLLNDMDLSEHVAEWYDRLAEWRQIKFLPVVADERVPRGTVAVVSHDDLHPLGLRLDAALSLPDVGPLDAGSQQGKTHEMRQERQSLPPSDGSEEPSSGEA